MDILGISNPWYGVGINDSAGSLDSNEIIQPYSSPVSINNLLLPPGTTKNLMNYILSFWLNPLTLRAFLSDIVTVGFSILGMVMPTSEEHPIESSFFNSLVISAVSNLVSMLVSGGITFSSLSISKIASMISQYGISMLYSLASFLLLQGLPMEIAIKLASDYTGIGLAISLGQFVIDCLAILDAIVTGTLYTNYKVVKVEKYNSLSISDPQGGVPYVYVTENESNYGYYNKWIYNPNQFFMHSSGVQNGYSFMFPDPDIATIIVENPYPFPLVFNLTVNAPSGSITLPVTIAGDQKKEYIFTQNNSTIEITPKYTVTFTESGLPSGTIWYVNLSNGQSFSSTTNIITFNEPNGTYSYTISTKDKNYAPVISSGTFTVNGSNVNQTITFKAVTTPTNVTISNNYLLYIIIVIVVIIAVLGVVMAMRRGKNKGGPKQWQEPPKQQPPQQ
jgi:hypothetical protein